MVQFRLIKMTCLQDSFSSYKKIVGSICLHGIDLDVYMYFYDNLVVLVRHSQAQQYLKISPWPFHCNFLCKRKSTGSLTFLLTQLSAWSFSSFFTTFYMKICSTSIMASVWDLIKHWVLRSFSHYCLNENFVMCWQ